MIAALERFQTRLTAVARFGVWCGGAMMLAAAVIISLEVLLRKLFLVSLGGADEMASYALAIGTVWALAFALLQRAHIRVDALYVLLPRRLAAILDVVALMSILIFAKVLAWYATGVFLTSWDFEATANTPLGTPLWIPQGLWVLGLWLFVLTVSFLALRTFHALVVGEIDVISRIAGTKSVDEELDEEIALVERAAHPAGELAEAARK